MDVILTIFKILGFAAIGCLIGWALEESWFRVSTRLKRDKK